MYTKVLKNTTLKAQKGLKNKVFINIDMFKFMDKSANSNFQK